jgi:hypothetical protein
LVNGWLRHTALQRAPLLVCSIFGESYHSNFRKSFDLFSANMDKNTARFPTAVSSVDASLPMQPKADRAWGRPMRFLLRMVFWLGIILVLLPSAGSQPKTSGNVSASEAMSAVKATVSDVRSFCARQAETCVVGGQAAVAIGQRAQAGAKMLYELLTEWLGPAETGAVRPLGKASLTAGSSPSLDTLAPADRALPWRAPRSRKPHTPDSPA